MGLSQDNIDKICMTGVYRCNPVLKWLPSYKRDNPYHCVNWIFTPDKYKDNYYMRDTYWSSDRFSILLSDENFDMFELLFSVILILANVFAVGLMDSLERTGEAEKELALQHQSAKLQTENYLALEKSYRSQRAASHEFKHQLGLIRDLLAEGHPEEAQRYIDQLQGQQNARLFAVNSGNPIVDAIFNEKYQRAREEGIDIRFQVNDLSQISIQTDDLSFTLDYGAIYDIVAAEMKQPSNLIENVAGRIRDAIEEAFPELEEFEISVSKLNPPLGGQVDCARITLSGGSEQ